MPETSTTILIGKKPVMNYVLACLTMIQNGANEVVLKARGRAISKAVDIAEITRKKFAQDLVVKNIKIDTEQIKNPETGNVSSIEIYLGKAA